MIFLAICNPNFLLISTKSQLENTRKARQARKQGVFRKISLRKLDVGFSSQRLEKLDFLRTNKLNGFNYHYYSLLLSSDNGWELNLYYYWDVSLHCFLSLSNLSLLSEQEKSYCIAGFFTNDNATESFLRLLIVCKGVPASPPFKAPTPWPSLLPYLSKILVSLPLFSVPPLLRYFRQFSPPHPHASLFCLIWHTNLSCT